jgi:hypothetical protein
MKELKRIERLIKETQGFLKKYEDALVDDPNSFGTKLMVGNLKRHLEDLKCQAAALQPSKNEGPTIKGGRMVASSAN